MNQTGSYIFTVKFAPGIWRNIQINKTATLEDLHDMILKSYEFDDGHLYAFFMDNQAWSSHCFSSPYYPNGDDASKVRLYEFEFQLKDKFLYLYDFGDEWRFTVTVFKELDTTIDKPDVIEIKGNAPSQY